MRRTTAVGLGLALLLMGAGRREGPRSVHHARGRSWPGGPPKLGETTQDKGSAEADLPDT
jgi:hypothetical protein